jgi:hypothetical protein
MIPVALSRISRSDAETGPTGSNTCYNSALIAP